MLGKVLSLALFFLFIIWSLYVIGVVSLSTAILTSFASVLFPIVYNLFLPKPRRVNDTVLVEKIQNNKATVNLKSLDGCATGVLCYKKKGKFFEGEIKVKGLKPNTFYWLCINSAPNASRKALKGIAEPIGIHRGYWYGKGYKEAFYDFLLLKANKKGQIVANWRIQLSKTRTKYRAKF